MRPVELRSQACARVRELVEHPDQSVLACFGPRWRGRRRRAQRPPGASNKPQGAPKKPPKCSKAPARKAQYAPRSPKTAHKLLQKCCQEAPERTTTSPLGVGAGPAPPGFQPRWRGGPPNVTKTLTSTLHPALRCPGPTPRGTRGTEPQSTNSWFREPPRKIVQIRGKASAAAAQGGRCLGAPRTAPCLRRRLAAPPGHLVGRQAAPPPPPGAPPPLPPPPPQGRRAAPAPLPLGKPPAASAFPESSAASWAAASAFPESSAASLLPGGAARLPKSSAASWAAETCLWAAAAAAPAASCSLAASAWPPRARERQLEAGGEGEQAERGTGRADASNRNAAPRGALRLGRGTGRAIRDDQGDIGRWTGESWGLGGGIGYREAEARVQKN